MTLPIIICDDSNMARRQMARSLPASWEVNISFAEHGQEALTLIRGGKGAVVFLDLNMPVLDGYETLKAIREDGLDALVIVVSGDIQPDAYSRVMSLGALGFIKKPCDNLELVRLLEQSGLFTDAVAASQESTIRQRVQAAGTSDLRDSLQEVANVAMGRSADLLARLLDEFVQLPIPKVNLLEVGELHMALSAAHQTDTYSVVCQGFIGSGIAGEALLIFSDASFPDMARLLQHTEAMSREVEIELLMDLASILSGAFIKSVGQLLDVDFSQGVPSVLGQKLDVEHLVTVNAGRWSKAMAVEIPYRIENYQINCEMLLLFTEDSLDNLQQRMNILLDDA
jgi:chemotaxis protein CheY-P-specific phosphatase CheC/AmiR/NasT family two-component response regulator